MFKKMPRAIIACLKCSSLPVAFTLGRFCASPTCLINSGLLTSRNFNCNLFRCEDQRHPGTWVDIGLLVHNIA